MPPPGSWSLPRLPQVSVRFGQPASYIDPDRRRVTTADGMEFGYDQLVIATGSSSAHAPVEGSGRCLSYSTIDDAARLGDAVKDVTRVLGRRPLGILVGTGTAAGQAEAVLRARGVRPVRTTRRPAAVVPTPAGSVLPAAGIVFEDGCHHERRPRGPGRGTDCPRRTGRERRAADGAPRRHRRSAGTSARPCRASGRSAMRRRSTASGWACSWPPVLPRRSALRSCARPAWRTPWPRPPEGPADRVCRPPGGAAVARWSLTSHDERGAGHEDNAGDTGATQRPPGKGPP